MAAKKKSGKRAPKKSRPLVPHTHAWLVDLDPKPGEVVLIRTVTHYYTGRIEAVSESWILLEDAAWIPDTGPWTSALVEGQLAQVQPFPNGCMVNRSAIVDICPWPHPLPRVVR
jgi:hypothetical protein